MPAMRIQVSVFAVFSCTAVPSPSIRLRLAGRFLLGVEYSINALGQYAADAGYFSQVVHTGGGNALQSTEVTQQIPAPLGTEPRNVLEHGAPARFRTLRPVAGDGETVRLVADVLYEQQRRRAGREGAWIGLLLHPELLAARPPRPALGHRHHLQELQIQIGQDLQRL